MGTDICQSGRICLYDNVRFVLISLVVVGHVLEETLQIGIYQSLFLWIYAFHMPLFLFLAGMFHKDRDPLPLAMAYFCIGLVLKIGCFMATMFLPGEAEFSLFSEPRLPWYMFVLAVYTMAAYILRNINKVFLLLLSCMIGCFFGYDKTIDDLLCLSRMLTFCPFFFLGQLCDPSALEASVKRPCFRTAGAFVLMLWLMACVSFREKLYPLINLFTGKGYYAFEMPLVPWGVAYRIFCYGVSFLVGGAILCVMPRRELPIMTKYGGRTLQIYCWHWPIVRISNAVFHLSAHLCVTPAGMVIWALSGFGLALLLGRKVFGVPINWVLRMTGTRQGPVIHRKIKTGLP